MAAWLRAARVSRRLRCLSPTLIGSSVFTPFMLNDFCRFGNVARSAIIQKLRLPSKNVIQEGIHWYQHKLGDAFSRLCRLMCGRLKPPVPQADQTRKTSTKNLCRYFRMASCTTNFHPHCCGETCV